VCRYERECGEYREDVCDCEPELCPKYELYQAEEIKQIRGLIALRKWLESFPLSLGECDDQKTKNN
jgi:hypothetical protein